MDKLSLLGIVIAFAALIGGYAIEGGVLSTLFHLPAFIIVFGGTLGAVLLQSPHRHFVDAIKFLPWIFTSPAQHGRRQIEQVKKWAAQARQDGVLSLEHAALAQPDAFTSRALQLLVDGVEPHSLRDSLEIELTAQKERFFSAARVYEAMGGYSPTIGILGAVLGLIQAMSALSDPDKLGAGVATAFVATIYGVALANFVYLPIAGKMKALAKQQLQDKAMLIEGLIAVARGENPRAIELRLSSYLVDPDA